MNNLPNNTYYNKDGILINTARNKNNTKLEIDILKDQIKLLQQELENVNQRINKLNNK
jgi:vacuolar-type H+-ATPase subunit D/Vma8